MPIFLAVPGFRFAAWAWAVASIAALALLGAPVAEAQQRILQRNYDKNGDSRIEMEALFAPIMSRGYLPVRVTIRNAFVIDRTWYLEFAFPGDHGEIAYRSNFAVPVDAGTEAVRELLVPVPTRVNTHSYYRQLNVRATSPGLPGEGQTDSFNLGANWPCIALSKKLGDRNLNRLNTELGKSHGGRADTFGATFDAAMLPSDWRAYSGLDVLMISEEEWQTLAPSPRLAILEWNRLGGNLDIYSRNKNSVETLKSLDFIDQGTSGNQTGRGLGKVRIIFWNGQDLAPAPTVNRYRSLSNLGNQLAEDYQRDWPLQRTFGSVQFNGVLVVMLLIAFGIVVGPINLFVLAKPGQRQKLFITTPIISLIASLLILAIILLGDGVGGNGRRMVLAALEPGANEKRLYLIQEQISRTGVLLGKAFKVDESVFLSPVMIPISDLNRMDRSGSPVASYSLDGNTYRGDWYQSRAEQGHYLQSVLPTRSRIELQAAGSADGKQAPKLFSSLEFTLDEFFYRDAAGQVWKSASSGPISGGEPIALTASNMGELQKWWAERIGAFSAPLRNQAKALTNELDHFFAVSEDSQAGFIDTLGSINWKDDIAVIHGSTLAAGSLPAADSENPPAAEPSEQ